MNLFLDSNRIPSDTAEHMLPRIGEQANVYKELEWHVVRDFREFVSFIKEHGLPERVSFGHDLAEEHYEILCACGSSEDFPDYFNEKTGLDCAKWMTGYHIKTGGPFPEVMVHSMNPYGSERLHEYINNYKQMI